MPEAGCCQCHSLGVCGGFRRLLNRAFSRTGNVLAMDDTAQGNRGLRRPSGQERQRREIAILRVELFPLCVHRAITLPVRSLAYGKLAGRCETLRPTNCPVATS